MISPLARRLALPALLGLLAVAAGPVTASAATGGQAARTSRLTSPAVRADTLPAGLPNDRFDAVACPSTTDCLATGTNISSDAGIDAASWNGSAWQAQDPVTPPGSAIDSAQFLGESCPAVQRCVVVGEYQTDQNPEHTLTLAELWTGSSWQQLNTRYPSSDDHLGGVSCPGTDDCIAVGGDRGFGGSKLPLAELWQGGAWTTMTTPAPGSTGYDTMLNSVSCTGTSWCMAVGQYDQSQQRNVTYALTEVWNGSTWKQVTAPGGSLTSVSCASPTACVAISGSTVLRWNGTTWSTLATPPGQPGGLATVSCRTASDCLIVGNTTAAEPTAPYAAVWTGSGYTVQTVPSPASGATLTAAVCPTATGCTAVGASGYASDYFSMAATWNGKTWAASRIGRLDNLNAVSCRTGTSCLAVGDYLNPGDLQMTMAEQESQSSWQAASPEPPSAGSSGLTSVSCLSATDCMAVDGPLGDHWNGTAWQQTKVPVTLLQNGSVASVSCSGQVCVAVSGRTAAEWNGTSWKKLPAPIVPSGSTGPYLGGISCVSGGWCLAVGYYYTDPHDSYGLDQAEVWNGTSWKLLDPPAGSDNSGLAGVSCTSETNCMTVGDNFNDASSSGSFAAAWNGSTWKLAQIGSQNDTLAGVACATASHCIAVGLLQQPSEFYPYGQPIAENWSAGTWSADKVGVANATLSGISCGGGLSCVAVGSYNDGQTLAVHWNGSHWTSQPTANP